MGTAWALLGSARNGQEAFYLFQKHLLSCVYVHFSSHCGGRFWNGQKVRDGARSVYLLRSLPTRQELAIHLFTTTVHLGR